MGDPDHDDDLATRQDLPELRRYDAGPPTIEERVSPFASDSGWRSYPGTAPGIAAIPVTAPRIQVRELEPSAPSDGVTLPDGFSSPFAVGPDGATSPDGVPALVPVTVVGPAPALISDGPISDGPTVVGPAPTHPHAVTQPQGSGWGREVAPPTFGGPPSSGFGGPPVSPVAVSPVPPVASAPPAVAAPELVAPVERPSMPAPDAPNVVVSHSLVMAAVNAETMAASEVRAPRVRRPPAAPTEVMLPALKRKARKKESSDWPLIAGLIVLVLVIVGLVAGVVIGVMRSQDVAMPFEAPTTAEPAEPVVAPGEVEAAERAPAAAPEP